MEQNNLMMLADISFEGKNYADSYAKYSQIIENDINNLDAWIGKALSAGFLSTAEKETLSEVSTILNHISKQNLSDQQNNKIAENNAFTQLGGPFFLEVIFFTTVDCDEYIKTQNIKIVIYANIAKRLLGTNILSGTKNNENNSKTSNESLFLHTTKLNTFNTSI